jgi:hypothetical protein
MRKQHQQHRYQPLFIRPNTSKFFHPTERSGIITLKKSEKMELFCSTGFSFPSNINGNTMSINCKQNDHFQFDDFACRKHPIHSTRNRDTKCFNNSTLVDIGFSIQGEKFLIVMTSCHDPIRQQTYYSQYQLTPANYVATQHGVKRPSFIQSNFFPGKDINAFYRREHQRKILNNFIHPDELTRDDAFLSRGKLYLRRELDFASMEIKYFIFHSILN